jgi:hypothetical protein
MFADWSLRLAARHNPDVANAEVVRESTATDAEPLTQGISHIAAAALKALPTEVLGYACVRENCVVAFDVFPAPALAPQLRGASLYGLAAGVQCGDLSRDAVKTSTIASHTVLTAVEERALGDVLAGVRSSHCPVRAGSDIDLQMTISGHWEPTVEGRAKLLYDVAQAAGADYVPDGDNLVLVPRGEGNLMFNHFLYWNDWVEHSNFRNPKSFFGHDDLLVELRQAKSRKLNDAEMNALAVRVARECVSRSLSIFDYRGAFSDEYDKANHACPKLMGVFRLLYLARQVGLDSSGIDQAAIAAQLQVIALKRSVWVSEANAITESTTIRSFGAPRRLTAYRIGSARFLAHATADTAR